MFEVPDIVVMPFRFKNLTITHFTCPSRQSLAQRKPSERRDLQSCIRTGGTHHNLERQTPTPIQLCGIMGGSELFKSKFLSGEKLPTRWFIYFFEANSTATSHPEMNQPWVIVAYSQLRW
jgi:hypothetical protein